MLCCHPLFNEMPHTLPLGYCQPEKPLPHRIRRPIGHANTAWSPSWPHGQRNRPWPDSEKKPANALRTAKAELLKPQPPLCPKPKRQAAAEKPSGLKKSDSRMGPPFLGKPSGQTISVPYPFSQHHILEAGNLVPYIIRAARAGYSLLWKMNASKRLQETSLPVFGFYHKSRNEKIYENLYHILRKCEGEKGR